MEMSGQLHNPTTLAFEKEAGLVTEVVSMWWKSGKIPVSVKLRNLVIALTATQCSWVILTQKSHKKLYIISNTSGHKYLFKSTFLLRNNLTVFKLTTNKVNSKTRHATQHTAGENTTHQNTYAHQGDLYINNISKETEDSSFLAQ
jgi:hypothetical protein